MNTLHRKPLLGTALDYFDAREAVDAIEAGAWDKLPYTSRVLAENLVRRCDPETLAASLRQLVERRRDLDFPWFPARVVCHDILGQTALVDLAGLRDAIAAQGGDPTLVNPVVPTQLVVDHSLAVECGGFDPDAFTKNRAIEDRRNEDRFDFIEWTKKAFKNVDVIPPPTCTTGLMRSRLIWCRMPFPGGITSTFLNAFLVHSMKSKRSSLRRSSMA
ncbi:MAG: acnD, partial [Massilia sp.]|nr:acnD [Massilia sp.]